MNPIDILGEAIIGHWTVEDLSAGLVASWVDRVNGRDWAQPAAGKQPTLVADFGGYGVAGLEFAGGQCLSLNDSRLDPVSCPATMGCVALSDYGTASGTILYVCEECGDDIREEQRREMIRKGVWCAEGQYVDSSGQLIGTPTNDGPDESFQLSRLYGPTFSFSDNARADVESRGDSESERSFENNSRGMPWVPLVVQMKSEELAQRLCVGDWDVGRVPKPVVFVTTAVDVQLDHFVVGTFGWDRDKIGYLIQHGTVPSWNDVATWLQTPCRSSCRVRSSETSTCSISCSTSATTHSKASTSESTNPRSQSISATSSATRGPRPKSSPTANGNASPKNAASRPRTATNGCNAKPSSRPPQSSNLPRSRPRAVSSASQTLKADSSGGEDHE